MRFAELATSLRDTSDRFGGIKHYLAAAGQLDRACSRFFLDQDLESLVALNGAVARAESCRREVGVSKGPVAL